MKVKDIFRKVRTTTSRESSVFVIFDEYLHEARSRCLRLLDYDIENILHIGASGAWYFKWYEDNYAGKIKKHTGMDLCARPPGLTDAIEWYQCDASDLSNLEPESYDMVFAGQFIEHIDCTQQAKFLTGVNRVLKKDGLFVMDSPNCEMSSKYGWKHPEHISEFTYEQAVVLTTLSGFDVIKTIGLVPESLFPPINMGSTGKYVKPIDMNTLNMDIDKVFDDNLKNCFVWWFICKKSERIIDTQLIENLCRSFYEYNAGKEKIRLFSLIGKQSEKDEDILCTSPLDGSGYVLFGPYSLFKPGTYTAGFTVKTSSAQRAFKDAVCKLDVVADINCVVLAEKELTVEDMQESDTVTLSFTVENDAVIQTRVYTYGLVDLMVDISVKIEATTSV